MYFYIKNLKKSLISSTFYVFFHLFKKLKIEGRDIVF